MKDPFISVKGKGVRFLARDVGALRSLGHLFPKASLANMTRITDLAHQVYLPIGDYGRRRREGERESPASLAAMVVAKKIPSASNKTCQRYLNLCCDLRLLHKTSSQYTLHPYGLPLAILSDTQQVTSYLDITLSLLPWKCYFTDRLLYEDGDNFMATLMVCNEAAGKSTRELGLKMRDLVFDELEKRMKKEEFPGSVTDIINRKIEKYETSKEKTRTFRRIEIEYTVRRDWLKELDLVKGKGNDVELTEDGKQFLHKLEGNRLNQEFFNQKIFSILAETYGMKTDPSMDVLAWCEKVFDLVSERKLRILETMALVNTSILLAMPIYIGDRSDILTKLIENQANRRSGLVLENGHRTPFYLIRKR